MAKKLLEINGVSKIFRVGGMLRGKKLVAVDDGSCQVNGWAAVGENGIAAYSAQQTKYRVVARLDETHIRILIL